MWTIKRYTGKGMGLETEEILSANSF
jgi:hypothetical protein